ncbi:uncharacterized protein LOC110876851 [Helianthus annuus]|uniref:uncharacterized protein LOC110876851 n=1 Tax=Helianthus annuus TaxID=4232 RepID=UPI000B90561F|nr:uncharacterized protein LOC110876851 [Helianthus annuus]
MNWVAWDKTIGPVEYGGLGFGSLRDANLAMLAKWWWRFKTEKNGLWRRIVWAVHHRSREWNDIPVKVSLPGPWKSIHSVRQSLLYANIDLHQDFSAVVCGGNNVFFWLDKWLDQLPLYVKFPALFKEESEKQCMVADRCVRGSPGLILSWAWSRPVLGSEAADQLQLLLVMLEGWASSVGSDIWKWRHEKDGKFSVSSVKKLLSSVNRVRPEQIFEWNNWVPKKIGIVAWRAEMERLPTKWALARRNIPVQNQFCVFCGDYEETCDHVFVSCHFAQTIWQNLAAWCMIPPIIAFGINDLLTLHVSSSASRKKRKVIHALVLVTFWSIWKSRNEVVFRQLIPNTTRNLDEIKSMTFLWVKSRSKVASLSWEEWSHFNLSTLI